jgi:phage/plasmid primase-like uncharacterized protein
MSEVINEFASAMRAHGLLFDRVIADGRIHYTSIDGKKRYNKAGRYQLHLNERGAIGWFMDWTTDSEPVKWRSRQSRYRPTPEQESEFRRQLARDRAERERLRKAAIRKAIQIWQAAGEAPDSFAYCQDKKVDPEGLRWCRWEDGVKVLLVPLYNERNKLVNLERIYPDGLKRFLTDGQVAGAHFWIAKPPATGTAIIICICEGWATGETIYQATGHYVVAACNAGNLLAVAEWVREKYPDAKIILCADDDWKTERNGRPYNTGVVKAVAAAHAIDGYLTVPRFAPSLFGNRKDTDTDFNDLFLTTDLETVERQINAAVELSEPESEDNEGEDEGDDDADESEKQVDVLLKLASRAKLFHNNDDGNGYADITVNGHRETWVINSQGFKRWLLGRYYHETGSAPSSNAMTSALSVIGAKAQFDGEHQAIYLRVAAVDGRVYLDLCDSEWRVIEIDERGWRLTTNAPVRFIRRKGMRALPEPTHGGSVNTLRKYLNVSRDSDFVLIESWALSALNGRGPYVILDVTGEQGTAKTTSLKVLRDLIDPNASDLRAPPRDERDLFIAASNAHVLGYDNLSWIPDWLSDALSRLATGGGLATRQLYTDDEERLFHATRPILLGAISEIVVRGDLADRVITIQLDLIADSKRRREREFKAAFEKDRPGILGALLDAVAHGLKQLPNMDIKNLPRMADYYEWVIACGDGLLWDAGAFAKAYKENREAITFDVVDSDPIAHAIFVFMDAEFTEWTGTATELLDNLEMIAGDKVTKSKRWPTTPSGLGHRFKRIAAPLRRLGIEILRGERQGKARDRIITITRSDKPRKTPSALSAPSARANTPTRNTLDTNDYSEADRADRADSDLQTSPLADRDWRRFRANTAARKQHARDAVRKAHRRTADFGHIERRRSQRRNDDDDEGGGGQVHG